MVYLRLGLAIAGALSLIMGLVITYRWVGLFRSQRERAPARVWVALFVRGLSIVAWGLLVLGASVADASVAPYLVGVAALIVFLGQVLWSFGLRASGASA